VIRFGRIFVFLLLVGLAVRPAAARPDFLKLFQEDPFRNPSVDGCATCHVNPEGGGPRNEFGQAFAANEFVITPMLRSNYPDRFDFATVQIPNGGTLHFSEPTAQSVVYEKDEQKYLIDLAAIAEGRLVESEEEPDPGPRHPVGNFSFFITSVGPGNGGNLGALAGADRHCQELASAVDAGHKTWRAYLSTSFDGEPVLHAGDRIGSGPWYNAKGIMVARGVADLHGSHSRLAKETALNEKGETVNGRGDDPNRHDILTGTMPDGTSAVGMNCDNWTSGSEGAALLGHFDREGGGDNPTSWNSAHPSRSCSQEDLRATGGDGLFYCFAIN
jgi:hypothetical protein